MFKSYANEEENKVVLRKFEGYGDLEDYNGDCKTALILDLETTGLDPDDNSIIELAYRKVFYDKAKNKILQIGSHYHSYNDPGVSIPNNITSLTGITNEMVDGKSIDEDQVREDLDNADLIVAYNAAFDRKFMDAAFPESKNKYWACGFLEVPWVELGFPSRKQTILAIMHNFFYDAHTALMDVDALTRLLKTKFSGKTHFKRLLTNSRRKISVFYAIGSPFAKKDLLKEKGYIWDSGIRCWKKRVFNDNHTEEYEWYVDNMDASPRVDSVDLKDKFKQW